MTLLESPHAIRSRAYEIWKHAGSPEGQALEHWLTAQRELEAMRVMTPWYESAPGVSEAEWMRKALRLPQPYAGRH